MNIGSNIKKVRELRDLKQVFLAKKLNISLNSYGKIERNEIDIQFGRLNEILKILDVSLITFFSLDENVAATSNNHTESMQMQLDDPLLDYLTADLNMLKLKRERLFSILEKLIMTEQPI